MLYYDVLVVVGKSLSLKSQLGTDWFCYAKPCIELMPNGKIKEYIYILYLYLIKLKENRQSENGSHQKILTGTVDRVFLYDPKRIYK